MTIKKHIPNIITSANLFCGCVGIMYTFSGHIEYAVYCIWIALTFDFMDGFSARLLKVSSPIGKELDSLADVVTFGVLPSAMFFKFFENTQAGPFSYFAFLIAIFSALRLAKFNVDENQSHDFIGMPTPANALFISSLVFILPLYPQLNSLYILFPLVVVCAAWLIAPIKLMALKFSSYKPDENKMKYLFIFLSLVFLFTFKVLAIPLIILSYLLLSIIDSFSS